MYAQEHYAEGIMAIKLCPAGLEDGKYTCMEWIMFPQNSYIDVLLVSQNVAVFED